MYKNLLFLVMLFYSFNLSAQNQMELTDRFKEFKKTSLEQISTMNWFQVDTFGSITAQFGQTNGDFMQSQESADRRDLSFFSEGLKKVNKIRFYGSFDFNYFRADSVANTMQYGYSDEIPYYFYAFRKGSWGGLKYDFNGLADWEINSRLNLMAGLSYKAENKWRKNDPRPEIFDQKQIYHIALQYKLNDKNIVSVGGNIQSFNFETTVGYMNKDLTDRYSDTGYINYMMYGYGYGLYWTTDRNIYKSSTGKSLQAAYSYLGDQFHAYLSVNYLQSNEKVAQKLTSAQELSNTYFGDVEYSQFNLSSFIQYQLKRHQFYSRINYQAHTIQDYNQKLFIQNYNNNKYTYSWLLGDLIMKDDQPDWEFNFGGSYQDWFRKDAAQGLIQQYNKLNLHLSAAKFINFKNQHSLQVRLSGGYSLPTTSSLKLPGIENTFIDRIVKYDYYFYNATVKDIGIQLQYNFPIQNLTTFVGFNGKWQFAEMPESDLVPRMYPGTSRSLFQIRFGVFL